MRDEVIAEAKGTNSKQDMMKKEVMEAINVHKILHIALLLLIASPSLPTSGLWPDEMRPER